jgi:hypothetical protein
MKRSISIAVPPLLLFCILHYSCHKHQSAAPPHTDTSGLPSMPLNITVSADTSIKLSELIISEPDGRILLDTVTSAGVKIGTTLHTFAKLVDLTQVYFSPLGSPQYTLTTYKAVNPSTLATPDAGDIISSTKLKAPAVNARMVYTNIPAPAQTLFEFNDNPNLYIITGLTTPAQSAIADYQQIPGNYAYFLLPHQNLYNLHIPKGINDTVDCAHIDTATEVTLTTPPEYYFLGWHLFGVMDTIDLTRTIGFDILQGVLPPTTTQVQYPGKFVKKFQLFTTWEAFGTDIVNTYNYSDTVPYNLKLPQRGTYYLNNYQKDNFSLLLFKINPAYYSTTWNGTNFSWKLFASPDSTNLNPLGLLTVQRSQLLKYTDLTSMKIYNFEYGLVPGFGYADYLTAICARNLLPSRYPSSTVKYAVYFR